MKVLHINTVETGKNGITNVIMNLIQAIQSPNITFDLLSINQPNQMYANIVEARGGKLYVIERTGSNVLKYCWHLRSLIKENHYDAVHLHANSHTVILDLMAVKLGGCKLQLVHSHNTTCSLVLVHKLLAPVFNSLYSHGLACGEDAGVWMFGKSKFLVIKNAVDTEKYGFNLSCRDKIRKKHCMEGKIVVGHVGMMIPAKNHGFLVSVFKELHRIDKNYKLLLIGDGYLRPEIEGQAEKLGISAEICYTGNINNVVDYLNAMDFIVMPSLYEGLPLSLMEQQANGLTCYVSDNITTEVDKTGNVRFLSLKLSAKEWAEYIHETNERKERAMASEKAIVDIKKAGYCLEEEAQKLSDYYLSLIKTN